MIIDYIRRFSTFFLFAKESIFMTIERLVPCIAVGVLVALLAIGLLPFLVVYVVLDFNGLSEIDASPLLALLNK